MISIEEARKILGPEGQNYTDEEIRKMIIFMQRLSKVVIKKRMEEHIKANYCGCNY